MTAQPAQAWQGLLLPDHPDEQTPVVLRSVRKGMAVPLFGDDFWNLACIDHSPSKSPPTLTFNFPDPYFQQIAKELLWQRLNVPVPSLRKRGSRRVWSGDTCEKALYALRHLSAFLSTVGVTHLRDLTHGHIDEFALVVQKLDINAQHQASVLKIVDCLYESRAHLSGGGLTFVPWPNRSTEQVVAHVAGTENATPRIPEEILGPLLAWALVYVEHFSGDIIAADRFHRAEAGSSLLGERAAAALAAYVATDVAKGGGVPATMSNRNKGGITPAYAFIARRAGVSLPWLHTTGAAQLAAAISQYGLDLAFLHAPKFRFEDAVEAWRAGMGVTDMFDECRRLTVACYIICSYLSGMRDGEVQALERDCLRTIREADGTPYRYEIDGEPLEHRGKATGGVGEEDFDDDDVDEEVSPARAPDRYKVAGLTFKHEATPKKATWVVIEPAARAIGVLKELTAPLAADTGEKHIFVRLHTPSQSNRLIKEMMSTEIRAFARHCNEVLAPRLPKALVRVRTTFSGHAKGFDVGRIPDGKEGPWNFTTNQFRRTMAWHIGNRPMGVIAGMIQYKHAGIQMFEGYAGTSKSEFRAEIAQEEASAKREDVVVRYEEFLTGVLPAGPMAAELKALFAHIAKEAGPTPLRVDDDRRVNKLVRNLSSRLYPGVLADCFYVPSRARCHMTTEPELRETPVPALCDPDCSSACWTHKHLKTWEELRAETTKLRGRNGVSPEQRAVFDGMVTRVDRRIKAIKEASGGKGTN